MPLLAVALAVSTTVACTAEEAAQQAGTDPAARPRVMAALGDSITRGFAACGTVGECVDASWATGTDGAVDSHRQRLQIDAGRGDHNLAVSGARVADLAAQVRIAVRHGPDYVTILIGANDACASDDAAMTPVDDFTAAFGAALGTLVAELPEVRILVLSVPDLARLWAVGRDRQQVRTAWQSLGICPSMLADPTDTGTEAQARRDRVRSRVQEYNAAMAAACARHPQRCRYDGNAVFDTAFELADVSTVDYFHPSARGQAKLARIAWVAGFWP